MTDATHCDVAQVWTWLADVPDPEIPVLSIVDLGVVREVAWSGDDPGECLVTVTPTYSGCPASVAIDAQIRAALRARGIARVRIAHRLFPAWTTDWMSDRARQRLRAWGIAPPEGRAATSNALAAALEDTDPAHATRQCPRCGTRDSALVSAFGSTPCKALYRCRACREPFDYFKCH